MLRRFNTPVLIIYLIYLAAIAMTTALLVFSTIMNHPIRKFVVIALIGEVNRKLLANACNAIAKPLDNSAGAEPLLHEVTNFEPEVCFHLLIDALVAINKKLSVHCDEQDHSDRRRRRK